MATGIVLVILGCLLIAGFFYWAFVLEPLWFPLHSKPGAKSAAAKPEGMHARMKIAAAALFLIAVSLISAGVTMMGTAHPSG